MKLQVTGFGQIVAERLDHAKENSVQGISNRVMAGTLPLMVVALVALFVLSVTPVMAEDFIWGRVTHVYDGDTVLVEDDKGKSMRVQLAYIDAPDLNTKTGVAQPFYNQAKNELSTLVKDKEVIVESFGVDKFRRVQGIIFLDKINVNLELIRRGLAEIYHPVRTRKKQYNQYYVKILFNAENVAKGEKVNIWGDPSYVSPYDFRRMK